MYSSEGWSRGYEGVFRAAKSVPTCIKSPQGHGMAREHSKNDRSFIWDAFLSYKFKALRQERILSRPLRPPTSVTVHDWLGLMSCSVVSSPQHQRQLKCTGMADYRTAVFEQSLAYWTISSSSGKLGRSAEDNFNCHEMVNGRLCMYTQKAKTYESNAVYSFPPLGCPPSKNHPFPDGTPSGFVVVSSDL